ncbi:hypothetical protein COR52_01620 [Vibrio mediterranei]|uniref:Uncharacterized protein n=1 Tax=Vibrio mediterranei TaxID=689 RepID=A0ABX5DJY4_9VIBR|nr:hypothetical protein COR52_01620 [Vibrio mediterranei]PRQ69368.1 hypothetical protein COR51_01895 [Vibrio mediterranei]
MKLEDGAIASTTDTAVTLNVTPAEAGVLFQRVLNALLVDPCLRRNDEPLVVGNALGKCLPVQVHS